MITENSKCVVVITNPSIEYGTGSHEEPAEWRDVAVVVLTCIRESSWDME